MNETTVLSEVTKCTRRLSWGFFPYRSIAPILIAILLSVVGASSSYAQENPPTPLTPRLPNPFVAGPIPVGEPFDRSNWEDDKIGWTCQTYKVDGGLFAQRFSVCKHTEITNVDVCEFQTLPDGGDGANTFATCESWTADGRFITRGDSTEGVIGDVDNSTDAATGETTSTYESGSKSCSAWDVAACIRSLPGMLMVGIAFFFLTLSGIILFVAGTVFNFVVLRTVFQFGTYFGTSDGMLIAWGVMRDIANIGLLFGFIFMGVLLILNVDGGGHGHGGGISAKKAIPKLIIFAVLLNFSLFASQAVIDVSNAFASSFATLAGEEECDTTTTTRNGDAAVGGTGLQSCANIGISGKILAAAGLTAIWDGGASDNDATIGNLLDRPYSYAVSLIMLAIFVLITALVLLAGAIMLIIRVVVLSLLMVTSPIGFAGMAIPKLQSMASMWWSKLMSQAFFAPVYLLLIFISIKLTEGLMDGEATLANAMLGNQGNSVAGNMQVVMVFLVVIGFMIGSLMAATKMGAMGASFATNTASSLAFGAAARGSSLAIGGIGMGVSRLSRVGLRPGQEAGKTRLRMESLGNTFKNTNADIRRTPGMAALLGSAGITSGATPGNTSLTGMQHQFDEAKGASDRRLTEAAQRMKTKQLEDAAHDSSLNDDPALSPAQRDERAQNRQFLASLSVKELEALHGVQEGVEQIAENLSAEQFDKMMGSDKLTDTQKGKLKAGRFKALNTAAAAGNAAKVKELIGGMTKKDLENLPPSLMANATVLGALSDKQRDDLAGSDKRTMTERNAIKGSFAHAATNTSYNNARDQALAGGSSQAVADAAGAAAIAGNLTSLKPEQVAKIDSHILTNTRVASQLTPAMLAKLARENKLTSAEMSRIGTVLRSRAAANPAMARYMAGPGGDAWL